MSDRKSGGRVQVEEGRQKGWVDGFGEEKWGKGEGRGGRIGTGWTDKKERKRRTEAERTESRRETEVKGQQA